MTHMHYKKLVFLVIISSLLFLTGCPGKEQQAQQKPESKQKIKIGVSLASMEFDGNQSIKKLMEERAKKDQVKLVWTDAKMDPTQQEKDIDKLIKQKVKAIILQTVDPNQGTTLVDKIVQAKIKVIGLETLPLNAPLDGYVASDHVRAGELLGKYVLMQMNGSAQPSSGTQNSQQQGGAGGQEGQQGQKGQQGQQGQESLAAKNSVKVLLLKGDPSDPVSQLIAQGAQGVLQQSKNIEQINSQNHPEGDPAMAQMTVQNALKAGSVDAILATDDRMANAAIKALKAENLDKKVITVAVGADQKMTKALSQGDHDAEVDIMPEQLANFALEAALDIANKGNWNFDSKIQNGNYDIPSKIIPVRLIEKNQVYLLEERWGKLKKGQEEQQGGQQQGSEGQGSQQGGSSGGGSQDGSQEGSQGSGQQGGKGGQGEKGKKTKVRIVTQDGKVMEVEVNGEIQKIEQNGGGGEQGKEGGQQGQQSGDGQGGGSQGGQ